MSQEAMNENAEGGLPPVDMEWLRECADGETETMRTMIGMYFTHTGKLLVDLEAAIVANSSENVRRLAHACSGSSGACGMGGIAELLRALEKMGAEGNLNGASTIASEVKREFERIRVFVTAQGLL